MASGLNPVQCWVRIPPGVHKWLGDVTGNRVRLKSEFLRVRIPPGLRYGPVMQLEDMPLSESGFWEFESPWAHKLAYFYRMLAWVVLCRRLIRTEHQFGLVAKLARRACLRSMYIDTLWVRIPPGLQT